MCVQKHRCRKIAHGHPGDPIVLQGRAWGLAHHINDHHHTQVPNYLRSMSKHHLSPISLHIHSQYQGYLIQVLSASPLSPALAHPLVLVPLTLYLCAQLFHHLDLNAAQLTPHPIPIGHYLTCHGQMHIRCTLMNRLYASLHRQDCHSHGLKTQSG